MTDCVGYRPQQYHRFTQRAQEAGLSEKGLASGDHHPGTLEVQLSGYKQIPIEQALYVTTSQHDPFAVHQTAVPGLEVVSTHFLLSNTGIELTTARSHRKSTGNMHYGIVLRFLQHPIESKEPSCSEGSLCPRE